MGTSPPQLTPPALERDTYPVELAFTDPRTGDSVVPATLSWTLTDTAGAVINGRSAVALTPAASVVVPISGADLAVSGAEPLERVLTISGTYDSTYGSDLPIRREFRFLVLPLVAVP